MAKKKIYFGTNTKMYKTIKDTVEFISRLQELTKDISREDMQLFVIPSYTTLRDANETKDKDLLMVGAQNMGWEEQGQFTGEISPLMLQEVGTDLVMIGHSERRHVLGETDEEENSDCITNAFSISFFPIYFFQHYTPFLTCSINNLQNNKTN